MFKKAGIAVVAGMSISLLVAGAAVADSTVVSDPTQDAIALDSESLTYGDYAIDLVSATIDHHDDVLSITSAFTITFGDSWNTMQVSLETTGDDVADFALVWSKTANAAKAFSLDASGAAIAQLCDITTAETMGAGGTVALTVARPCIGNPASVRAHVDVIWSGADEFGPYYFFDSAPGQLVDSPMTFSVPVNVSSTVVVQSPAPPVVAPPAVVAPAPIVTAPVVVAPATTKLTLKATSSAQKFGKKPVKLTAKVATKGTAKGKVKLFDGKKAVKTATVHNGKVTFTLSKKLKVGKHKLHAVFYPQDSKKFVKSTSKKITVKVAKAQ